MKTAANIGSSFLLGKTNSAMGFDQVLTIINLDDDPCTLIDLISDRILFLNTQMVSQSSFFNSDLKDKSTAFLFPGLDLKTVSSGETRDIELNRRGLLTVKVKARFDFIDPNGRWVVIRILPLLNIGGNHDVGMDKLFTKLIEFVNTSNAINSEEELFKLIDLVQLILNVDSSSLYLANPTYPSLQRVCIVGSVGEFPDELPSTDLARLIEPSIWRTGNRVFTEIHRFARMNNFNYVATAPLKDHDAVIGMLAVCGKRDLPEEMQMSLLQFLAFQINDAIQKMTLIRNLEDRICLAQERIDVRSAALDNIVEGIVWLYPDLTIGEINPAAEWMLGYADWEVRGQPYDNIIIGTDRLFPALKDAKKGNTTHDIGKVNLNRRNGQSFPAQVKVIPALTGEKLVSIELLITDISENEHSKALTQQLEHRAILGDYTAAFAHDVRNPINNISTGIQLLGVKLSQDDPNQEIVARVQNDCNRLNHMMESILAFSRPLELNFESIDLNLYLPRMIDRWRPRLAKINVTPAIHIDPGIAKIIGDPRSLDQVFTNLLTNAVEAMTDVGDTLAIRAMMNYDIAGHPNVDISVSDNGPGIPEDVKDHIFELFVTTRQKGTGLGLAITKEIVTAHKGSISVNSFPGGTVFTVRLPAENGD